ncbi:MAG: hypothetical protein R6V62_00415 [Candidatus Fermentibacteraceae bacterium]
MKPGEYLIVLLLLTCAGGVLVTTLKPGLDPGLAVRESEGADSVAQAPLSPVDQLSEGCSVFIYGNCPRQSFAGDTTVLTMDLDLAAFTVTQANLSITRLLRRCDITLHETRQRQGGGLTFLATLPDGKPLRMELKAPG